MPKFPIAEPQIIKLADRMLNGYFWHSADFPRIPNFLRIRLLARIHNYMLAKNVLLVACSNLRIATKTKNEKLQELKSIMKKSLQRAEVDVAANPQKLKLIGWGIKTSSQSAHVPGQPTSLVAVYKQDGAVDLNWKKPVDGRMVYDYIIERRCLDTNQSNNWTPAAISYDCRITLTNQPKDIKLEYRVRASNLAGQSLPSNTVAITL